MTDKAIRFSALSGDVIFSAPTPKPDRGQLAYWDTYWMKSSVAIVSVHGEIDSTNALALSEYSLAGLDRCRGLILDLTRLGFFGVEGFLTLHRISVSCARAEINWVLVTGAAVSIMLRVCDTDGLLPAADTIGAALASLEDRRRMETTTSPT